MLDYIIIGSGIAGICFAETALQNNKKIIVFDNKSQNSSVIAGGLYNPVILKRFSALQDAQEQITILNNFYAQLEIKLKVTFKFSIPILRKFFSIEEQNNWFIASDKENLKSFLSTDLRFQKISGIESPFGYGEVLQSGWVDTALLLDSFKKYLKQYNLLIEASFDYQQLQILDEYVLYKKLKAKHIVFAEGFGMHSNPYFKDLPLDGTKGELLIIKAPKLQLDVLINTSVFIIPLGKDLFKVGATYNWFDKTNLPTEAGKKELIDRLKEILTCDFEIVAHHAGIRPTVKDRKPLLGVHPNYKNIAILNGLGTRGVMLGPSMAKVLFDCIEYDIPLDKSIAIKRFIKN